MANGQIQDPVSNNNHVKCPTDSTSASDMKDTVEFRLLMAYAARRRPKQDVRSPTRDDSVVVNGGTDANGTAPTKTPTETETKVTKKRRKRKGIRNLMHIFKCVKPQTDEQEPPRAAEQQVVVEDRSIGEWSLSTRLHHQII